MQMAYFLAVSVFYVIIFWLRVFEHTEISKFFISSFVLLTVLYSFANAKDKSFKQGSLLVTLALAFAFIAETVINFFPKLPVPGVTIFCATHICLVIYYFKRKSLESKEILYAIPLLAISVIFCIAILPNVTLKLFLYGVPIYMVLLTLMLWRAVCMFNDKDGLKIILGSVLFYLVDISVIMVRAYGSSTALNIETWAMYPPALFLLSLVGSKNNLLRK
ncbi:MAG: lysoplasmalogenase family protein [Fibromonadaceae bacterium]|jgi:hypothetical protein|nr:lysoplasmalogenase family protein [Fibromonadaceae bacterium]